MMRTSLIGPSMTPGRIWRQSRYLRTQREVELTHPQGTRSECHVAQLLMAGSMHSRSPISSIIHLAASSKIMQPGGRHYNASFASLGLWLTLLKFVIGASLS
jgi:hypothetical protein